MIGQRVPVCPDGFALLPCVSKYPAHVVAEKKELALEALRDGASVEGAASKARVNRDTLRKWRQADEDFAIAWADAHEAGTDGIEDNMTAYAKADLSRPNAVTAAIFLLKARRPEKYAERHQITTQAIAIAEDAHKRLERVQAAVADDPELAARLADLAASLGDK